MEAPSLVLKSMSSCSSFVQFLLGDRSLTSLSLDAMASSCSLVRFLAADVAKALHDQGVNRVKAAGLNQGLLRKIAPLHIRPASSNMAKVATEEKGHREMLQKPTAD